MLTLTKKAEYALMAGAYLARLKPGEVASARQIAEDQGVKVPLLMSVLKTMNHCGLLRSIRGARGGYALAVPADGISVLQLVQAVEGPIRLVRCGGPLPADEDVCELSGECAIQHPLIRMQSRLRSFLDQVSLADIAADRVAVDGEAREQTLRILAQ